MEVAYLPDEVPIRDRIRAELRAQSPVLAAILGLAAAFRRGDSAAAVADAVEDIAYQIDGERRGNLSALDRQDVVVVKETIDRLLRGDLLDGRCQEWVREHTVARLRGLGALPPEPARRDDVGEVRKAIAAMLRSPMLTDGMRYELQHHVAEDAKALMAPIVADVTASAKPAKKAKRAKR